jgi:cytochrome c553
MRCPKGRWALLTALFLSPVAIAFLAPGALAQQGAAVQGVEQCVTCHGPGGNSVTTGTPSIAGQPRLFIENQLILIREGLRRSPAMEPVVKGMKDPQIIGLARHFSAQPPRKVAESPPDAGLAKQGRALTKRLHCGSCHVSTFLGQNQIPRLAGQREEYLESEMKAYRDGKRSGGDTIMAAALYGVKDPEIRALAHFLSHLEPSARPSR